MLINDFDKWCRSFLDIELMEGRDYSLNGLQVGQEDRTIGKVAFAVDACRETFEKAVEEKADLLFVHHGLFWGKPFAITGPQYKRMDVLLQNNLALYAVHLPLDMHPQLGNNAVIADILGLENKDGFGDYKGTKIGIKGMLPSPVKRDDLVIRLFGGWDPSIRMLPFGPEMVSTVGIISGGAPKEVEEAIALELDLYITGDAAHTVYHQSLEAGINVLFGGHYMTETTGVKAVMEKVRKELGLETVFIDVPTGL